MKNNLLILFIFLVSFSYGQQKTTTNDTYDLVILNGRVMDPETMFDDVANVGVKGWKNSHYNQIATSKVKKPLMQKDMWYHLVLSIHTTMQWMFLLVRWP